MTESNPAQGMEQHARELYRCTPDGRFNGQYQFVTGYTGGGAEMCAHLAFETIQDRLRKSFGDQNGTLADDGTDLIFTGVPMLPILASEPEPTSVEQHCRDLVDAMNIRTDPTDNCGCLYDLVAMSARLTAIVHQHGEVIARNWKARVELLGRDLAAERERAAGLNDPTPVDEEWAKLIAISTKVNPNWTAFYLSELDGVGSGVDFWLRHWDREFCPPEWCLESESGVYVPLSTRGQVRLACKLFGIELKEPARPKEGE